MGVVGRTLFLLCLGQIVFSAVLCLAINGDDDVDNGADNDTLDSSGEEDEMDASQREEITIPGICVVTVKPRKVKGNVHVTRHAKTINF